MEKPLTTAMEDRYLVAISLLVALVAKIGGGRLGNEKNPNFTQIADDAFAILQTMNLDIPGMKPETLRKKFSAAVRKLKEFSTP